MAVERHDHPAEKWIAGYARFGYAAKGVIYGGTGLLALLEAFDLTGGEVTSSTGVLKAIALQPLGRTLATIVAVSLMGYVVWRFIQAFFDPEHPKGHSTVDILRRVGYGCSGLIYASIAYTDVEILTGTLSGEGKTADEWAAVVMALPFGRWLVGSAGLLFFCIGKIVFEPI